MFRLNPCLLAIIESSKELTNIQNKAQSSKLFVTARAFHPSFTSPHSVLYVISYGEG